MKISNPFSTSGYVAPEYFCDRETESAQIVEAIRSSRNLTLISVRRMGKTALLKHVEHLLPAKEYEVIYLDLMPTQSSSEFLNLLGTALINVRNKERSFSDKIIKTLARLRPVISYDSLTGQPVVTLDVTGTTESYNGLKLVMDIISGIKKRIVVILDEFQQINHYEETNIEASLRSIVQQYPAISFIFSGSNKHMIETMFTSTTRPFFGSADMMNLETIPAESYSNFIQSHFQAGSRTIGQEEIAEILQWCRYHTYYVQYFCNRLYATEIKAINNETLNKVKIDILDSFAPSYNTYQRLLTKPQFALLQAIAVENEVSKPHSGDFIEKYKLKTSSTVKASLDSLANKEVIIYHNSAWQVYDVFLMRWLEYNAKGIRG